jgi:hypothetical protein
MKNIRAFKVQAVSPTDTKPARIKITDLRFSKSVTINYGAGAASNMHDRSIEHLNSLGIEIDSQAWSENAQGQHQYTILLTSNFTTQII